ncbi:MAG TPA: TetR family transcriptional regulator C-terminal domain-containing protein [Rhizomicrobium sp.]|jgi:TetR/AcrR family transcriptional repressor of nem operon|nr:TetR family transcriptional regulator C-terminal domain-containing protein [Rhizomicrobium sp.]
MTRVGNREKILTEGLKVVHGLGFANASVRDIVAAAGVPQGSFTNHFVSKEAFGLEVLDLYYADICEVMAETLLNDALPPLKRMRMWLDCHTERNRKSGFRNGCLIGNFTAEAGSHGAAIQARLKEIIGEIQVAIAACLKAAVKAGELPKGFDCSETAEFIFLGMQGATLVTKAQGNALATDRFKKMLFAKVLR